MEASVDPQPRGPDWMPITPKTGSLFHAETHPFLIPGDRREDGSVRFLEGRGEGRGRVAAVAPFVAPAREARGR